MGMYGYYSEEELDYHHNNLPSDLRDLLDEVYCKTGQKYRLTSYKIRMDGGKWWLRKRESVR